MIVLIIPILLICILLVTIFLLLLRRWRISLILLIICFLTNWYIEYCSMNFFVTGSNNERCLTIATHNIYSQGEYLDFFRHNPDSLYTILKRLDADVILIQEYDSIRCAKLTEWLARDGYKLYQKKHSLIYGENAIYSRFPLKNVRYNHDGLMMFADIFYYGRLISLFNCHLCSNNINEKVIRNDGAVDWIKHLPVYIRSIVKSSMIREAEAFNLRLKIDSCLERNIPVIVAGDMNDIGGSKPIKILEGKGNLWLHDVWWHSGNGIGNTYHGYRWLHFRLDHIFYSNHLNVIETRVRKQPFSDHEILITKFKIN